MRRADSIDGEILAGATVDDILVMNVDAAEQILHCTGVAVDGAGGLSWMEASADAVVGGKYRMMCAMLKDGSRNQSYARAIEQAVTAHLAATGGEPPLVLDIGSGFAFLGLIAARAGAHVIGCEMNAAVAAVGRLVIEQNALSSQMRMVSKRSDELIASDLWLGHRKVDLIVTETLDSELLREGIVPTLRHAHEHLLAPGGRIIPGHASVFAELVMFSPKPKPSPQPSPQPSSSPSSSPSPFTFTLTQVMIDATAASPCLSQLNSAGLLQWDRLEPAAGRGARGQGPAAGRGSSESRAACFAPVVGADAWCSAEDVHAPLRVQVSRDFRLSGLT